MQVESVLDEVDCLELVKGMEVIPDPRSREGQVSRWLKKRKKACRIILASCTLSALIYLEGIKDPVETWKSLENKYAPKSSTTRYFTLKEFMNAKAEEGVDIEEHIQRVKTLKVQLQE